MWYTQNLPFHFENVLNKINKSTKEWLKKEICSQVQAVLEGISHQ